MNPQIDESKKQNKDWKDDRKGMKVERKYSLMYLMKTTESLVQVHLKIYFQQKPQACGGIFNLYCGVMRAVI